MKKVTKRFFVVILTVALVVTAVLPVFAAIKPKTEIQPLWTNMQSMEIEINKYSGNYAVTVNGKTGTTKIEVTATLYEQGTAGYVKKDSFTVSKNTAKLSASDTYSFNTNKRYKVVATAKVTANGITENVTLEKVN